MFLSPRSFRAFDDRMVLIVRMYQTLWSPRRRCSHRGVYSTDLVLQATGVRSEQDRSASQADIESCLLCQGVGSRRAIQTSNTSAGIVATVVSRKNGTQPSLSASTPPEDATIVRPTAASDESSAYWVAVNAGEHRSER